MEHRNEKIRQLQVGNLKISAGQGQASYPMEKGSFEYREELFSRTDFIVKQETEESAILQDEKENCCGRVCMNREENRLHIHMEFDNPDYNRYWLTVPVEEDEHFYGCGETFSEFDLKGQKVRIWVAEHQNFKRISEKLRKQELYGKTPKEKLPFSEYESYYAQPTFTSSRQYYVHVDGSCFMEFDFSQKGYVTLYMRECCDVEIGFGDSFTEVSALLTERLGRQPQLPDWLYDGMILGIQGGTETVERKIQRALDAGAKICGVWCQDWCGCRRTDFGYQVMWNWEWNRDLYPGLDEKIQEWKDRGVHFLGYINPFMALEKELYQYASEHGYCVKDKEGKDYLVTITTFPAAMIDFTNPAAYAWYKNVIRENLIGMGLSGWMADFGEYLPTDCVLYSGENPENMHNQWPALWARMNREAIEECGKMGEVFFFTRAGFTETVKTSTMMWNGDQHVDWSVDDGLLSVIPATLSLAMSGFGLVHSDVGGYTTKENMTRSRELLMRWEEMNAFSTLMRSHEGNQPWRNVQFDDDGELLAQLAKTTKWHVALRSYLKETVQQEAECGIPVMRPLFYHYDEESAYTEDTEYLLGRDILVAPVYEEGKTMRTCYLPQDEWVHLFTGKTYSSGIYEVEVQIGCPPVFIRRDSPWAEELMPLFLK